MEKKNTSMIKSDMKTIKISKEFSSKEAQQVAEG